MEKPEQIPAAFVIPENIDDRITWKKIWGHFKTVTHHRHLVRHYCFKMGLYLQGLTHDLSKYSLTEFSTGARFYQGNKSPNGLERFSRGYSKAWLHHKGRNKHHLEYWTDYDIVNFSGLEGLEIPRRYIAEMVCDRIAACRTYNGPAYTQAAPLEYYLRNRCEQSITHPKTKELLIMLLTMIKEKGEDATCEYVKNVFLKET